MLIAHWAFNFGYEIEIQSSGLIELRREILYWSLHHFKLMKVEVFEWLSRKFLVVVLFCSRWISASEKWLHFVRIFEFLFQYSRLVMKEVNMTIVLPKIEDSRKLRDLRGKKSLSLLNISKWFSKNTKYSLLYPNNRLKNWSLIA